MESSFDLFFSDNNEDEYSTNVARIRKSISDHSNPLELPNTKFFSYFRLNKEAFVYILDEIKDLFRTTVRSSSIPQILKLAAAFRFFSEGSYQKCSGNDFNLGLAQPSVSVVLKEVFKLLEEHICPKWIKAQLSEEEQRLSKIYFFEKTGFPGIIGCVNGTYVRITAQKKKSPTSIPEQKRLNKEAFVYILDEIKDLFRTTVRSSSIPQILKLAAAFRFFSEGSYQKCSGNDFNLGLAQPSVSVVLKEVFKLLEEHICPKWIKAQLSEEEQRLSKIYFFEKTGFPGIIGCVNGTYVRITAQKKKSPTSIPEQKRLL